MSTYMAKKENVDRKWYVIDAAGVPLGKTAVKAANILRGKNKPEFTPNVDCGDFVIIINASKAVLTGKKLDQKIYYHHSGYIGGSEARDLGVINRRKLICITKLNPISTAQAEEKNQ